MWRRDFTETSIYRRSTSVTSCCDWFAKLQSRVQRRAVDFYYIKDNFSVARSTHLAMELTQACSIECEVRVIDTHVHDVKVLGIEESVGFSQAQGLQISATYS